MLSLGGMTCSQIIRQTEKESHKQPTLKVQDGEQKQATGKGDGCLKRLHENSSI